MTKLVARAELWEADEYVIFIGPEAGQGKWDWGGPCGGTLSKRAADAVVDWLNDRGGLGGIVKGLQHTLNVNTEVV